VADTIPFSHLRALDHRALSVNSVKPRGVETQAHR
jgi:hypothetical protein